MENSPNYLDPQTLASLEGLDLQARLVVEGYVAGMHPSPYHGFSVEFAEHREYVPGDDIRHVDWKVWCKTDKLYLKQYEEETNLLLYLLPQYIREGKSYLTIAIGCTGGRHRSVFLTEEVASALEHEGYKTKASHRDIGR